jgi:hypothetical protein
MSAAMDAWREERDRRVRQRDDQGRTACACPRCLPYPNQAEADRWRPGRPIPEGWRHEPGWGLTSTEEWST